MKKFLIILLTVLLSVSCVTRKIDISLTSIDLPPNNKYSDYTVTIDLLADQTDVPYNNYAAFYLINTTNFIIEFELFGENKEHWNAWGYSYWEHIKDYGMGEIIIDKDNRNTLILLPNEKVRMFSAAFAKEKFNHPNFPPYLDGFVFINGEKKLITAYIN